MSAPAIGQSGDVANGADHAAASPPMPPPGRTRSVRPIRGPLRYLLIAVGLLCVALGIVGIWLPGMPTTVFLILALAAFARSSERLHTWLITHPQFGDALRNWLLHRAIPRRVKLVAVATMVFSLVVLALVGTNWVYLGVTAALMGVGAVYIVTRPAGPGL